MSAPQATPGGDKAAAPPAPGLRHKIAWLWGYWRPHRGFLVFLVIFTLISSAVTIAYPMVWKLVLDRLSQAAGGTGAGGTGGGALPTPGSGTAIPPEVVRRVLLFLGAIAVGRFIAGFYPCFRAWMNLRIDVSIREHVFRRILRKDYRFFNRFATGDLVTRLLDDISEYPKISWFACSGVFRAVDAGSRLLFCIVAMFLLDWRLSLLSLIPLPIMLRIIYGVRSRLTETGQEAQKAISRTNEMLEKTFSGIRIVKAFSAESGQARALSGILEHRIGVQYRLQRLWAAITTLDTVASRVGQLVVLSVGGIMVLQHRLTLGTLYAFYIYLDWLVQPMWDLPNLLVTSRQAFVCIDREEELIHFPEGPSRPETGAGVPALRSLEFERVSFAYEEARPTLEEVSFQVGAGETVALVGPVASGKSTVLKMAGGLLTPGSGAIRLNGRPLAEYRWEEFRRLIGYVPQDSLLFSESIRENVSMGRGLPEGAGGAALREADGSAATAGDHAATAAGDGAPPEEAWARRVLEAAQMGPELARMPEGMETLLGQKGSRVSGGQRQRISIARALYGKPELLLLDDCTASLDAENEDRLWLEVRSALPQATILLVSHRLATIRRAGRIVVLERGRVQDIGSHEELAARSEVYRRFLERAEEREMVLEGSEKIPPEPKGEVARR